MQVERQLNTCDDLLVRLARAWYESVNEKSVKLSDLERFDGCSESDQIFTSQKQNKKIDTPSLDKKKVHPLIQWASWKELKEQVCYVACPEKCAQLLCPKCLAVQRRGKHKLTLLYRKRRTSEHRVIRTLHQTSYLYNLKKKFLFNQ